MIINLTNREREMLEEYEEMLNSTDKEYGDNEPPYYLKRVMTNFVDPNMKGESIYIKLFIKNPAKANLFVDTLFNMRSNLKNDLFAESLVENTGCEFLEFNLNSDMTKESELFNMMIDMLSKNGYKVTKE